MEGFLRKLWMGKYEFFSHRGHREHGEEIMNYECRIMNEEKRKTSVISVNSVANEKGM